MNADEKAIALKKLTETDLVEDPEGDLLFPPLLDEKESAIQQMVSELRADRAAKEAAVTKRLELAIAKEEAMETLLAAQKKFVQELLTQGENAGDLVDANEAAAFLKISPRSLRWYAEQKIIPSYPVGKRKRRYNKAEIKQALEDARKDGRIAHDPEVRRRVLR